MEIEGGYNAIDCKGFININGIRLKAHNLVLRRKSPYIWRSQTEEESEKQELSKLQDLSHIPDILTKLENRGTQAMNPMNSLRGNSWLRV